MIPKTQIGHPRCHPRIGMNLRYRDVLRLPTSEKWHPSDDTISRIGFMSTPQLYKLGVTRFSREQLSLFPRPPYEVSAGVARLIGRWQRCPAAMNRRTTKLQTFNWVSPTGLKSLPGPDEPLSRVVINSSNTGSPSSSVTRRARWNAGTISAGFSIRSP